MPTKPVLVIHGGAGGRALLGARRASNTASIRAILERVYPKLARGMSATEAAAYACTLLENDPRFNAGYGSKIQSDGKIRMSASLMDGHRRRFAGCVNVEGVKNPIRLARKLLGRPDRVLATVGARKFARESGLEFASPYTIEQKLAWKLRKEGKSGTVGAVVLDRQGRLAAGTSTGGRGFEYPFRVSDSPTCAGNFANEVGAVSATGTGEQIVEQAAAATVCAYMETGFTVTRAVERVLKKARSRRAAFGLIALDKNGKYAASTTTPGLVWGAAFPGGIELF